MLQDSRSLWLSVVTPVVQLISGQNSGYKADQHQNYIITTVTNLWLEVGQIRQINNLLTRSFSESPVKDMVDQGHCGAWIYNEVHRFAHSHHK